MSELKERLTFRVWAIEQHRKTNHFYDKILPYEFHLQMVVREVRNHLKSAERLRFPDLIVLPGLNPLSVSDILTDAAYGHDLIEDTRNTYNDVRQAGATYEVADIIYALTDDKGKDRAERGNDEHYKKLVQVPGAAFVKFCDRIANVRYSKLVESSMFDKYKKEHQRFVERCYIPSLEPYKLVETLNGLFEI